MNTPRTPTRGYPTILSYVLRTLHHVVYSRVAPCGRPWCISGASVDLNTTLILIPSLRKSAGFN